MASDANGDAGQLLQCWESQTDRPQTDPGDDRVAVVGHVDGRPIGAPIYLTAEEIRRLGGDPDETTVVYRVAGGRLLLE